MNVVIILLDAVRAGNLSCYGYDKPTSPNIDEIASEGLLFENCFSQSTRTEPSLATIMSGKHPLNHGVVAHGTRHTGESARRLKESGTRLLPEILKSRGYETIAVDWLARWHKRGYDHYGVDQAKWKKLRWRASNLLRKISGPLWEFASGMHQKSIGPAVHRAACEKVTNNAIGLLEKCKRDFFLFVHYWDVHAPYSPPPEHRAPFDREGGIALTELLDGLKEKGVTFNNYFMSVFSQYDTLERVRSAYDGCIHWVDSQVGRLVDYLRMRDLLDDTLLIITADHGEALGEHGIYFTHAGLYDHTIHVPLILRHPKLGKGRIKELVQHTDITPTILDLLDIEKPDLLDGHPIPDYTRDEVYMEMNKSKMRAIRTDRWKYIHTVDMEYMRKAYWFKGGGKAELFDLREDPGEEENLIEKEPDKAQELKERLENKVREFRSKHEKGRVQRKLEKLNLHLHPSRMK